MARRTAALVAGWNRRFPTGFANTPASGESPNGLLTVELYLGGWIDITALGLVRYANGVTLTGGQPDETSGTNPGSCSMTLDNRDGRFSMRNPLGPYYGLLRRNTPIRVSVQSGNDRSYRFSGEVASWPQTWDPTGTDFWVDITAAGRLRRLQQGKTPLKSTIALYWANPGSFATPAVAYWPCEDGTAATQIASGIGGTPMTISGAPELASYTGFEASSALPVLNNASLTGRIPSYTPGATPEIGSSAETSFMFLLALASGGETSQVLVSAAGTGAVRTWEVYYTSGSGGSVGLRGKDASGAVSIDTLAVPGQKIDGLNLLVGVSLSESGGFGGGVIDVMDMSTTTVTSANLFNGAVTVGHLTSLTVDPSKGLSGTTIGHIAVLPGTSLDFTAYEGYSFESAGSRILRLLNFTGINNSVVGSSALGTVAVSMGPQRPATVLDLIQECVDADMGILYELRDQNGLGYRTHNTLVNQDPALTLNYPANQLTLVPAQDEDDSTTRNDWTVSRTNGSSAEFNQADGPLGSADPPSGVGLYDDSVELNLQDDSTLLDQAAWRVHLGTVDEPRFTQIAAQLAHPSITGSPTLRQQILAVGPGDRVVVQGPFPQPPHDDISQIVLGYSERIDQFTHQISWNCRPESPWRYGVLEDLVLSDLDTDGSAVALDATATATTLLVATTDPTMPLWTTNPADCPFDVNVGGERVTVTAISGASSPQTFTAVRSVNGIAKPQVPGTDVRLWQPLILGF